MALQCKRFWHGHVSSDLSKYAQCSERNNCCESAFGMNMCLLIYENLLSAQKEATALSVRVRLA
jgi:hypothetical protein